MAIVQIRMTFGPNERPSRHASLLLMRNKYVNRLTSKLYNKNKTELFEIFGRKESNIKLNATLTRNVEIFSVDVIAETHRDML